MLIHLHPLPVELVEMSVGKVMNQSLRPPRKTAVFDSNDEAPCPPCGRCFGLRAGTHASEAETASWGNSRSGTTAGTTEDQGGAVRALDCWRPRRDLNPCYRRERKSA
jgi:hypothetical protein